MKVTDILDRLARWTKLIIKTDSSSIGRQYAAAIALVAVFGLAAAASILLELATARPDILESSRFGVVLTVHGITMVFLVLIPLFPAVLGNLILPRAVGAPNTALPRLNLLGWYLFAAGALTVILAIEIGGYDGGWKMLLLPEYAARNGFVALVVGLLAVTLANCCLNLALVGTIFSRRHRSVTLLQLPLFVWFFALGMLLQLVVLPARVWYLLLHIDSRITDSLTPSSVAHVFLEFKQQLFWLYVNPAVLSVMLPAVGVACAVIGGKQERRLPRQSLLISGLALSQLTLVSWGQHLLTAIDSEFVAVMGSMFGLLTLIPGTIIFGLLLRAWLQNRPSHGSINIALLGQVLTFGVLAISGIALATPSLGVHLHNTYVTVGHLHFGAVGIGMIGFVAGVMYWWPQVSTRNLSMLWNRMWLSGMISGLLITFVPLLIIGLGGAPRGYNDYARGTQGAHLVAAIGGTVLIVSLIGWMVHCWQGGGKRSHTVISRDTIPETRSST
ncbi:MAG: cbb3-type cytochrome c oxidase subunit I [bacterium]|nr:cbb3-type cytochrome c oxidase subunit I [bacterium]